MLEISEPQASYVIVSHNAAALPENYVGLIYSKWLKSLRNGNPLFKKVDTKEYYKNYHIYIENLLKKPDSLVRLAVLSDDHDVVLGFAVLREDVLDYVFVHKNNRRVGIAKALVPLYVTTFTHITETGLRIWQDQPKDENCLSETKSSKYKYLKFNPFA